MSSPLRRQVRAESQLRFGSPLADLLSARRQNYHQYLNDVQTAGDSAHAVRKAAHQSIGELKQIYDEADATRTAAAKQIDAAVSVAGAPHSALAMALMGERGAATQRFAGERAAAQAEGVARERDATAGLAYAKRNALENFRSTRSDLMSRTRDIHSQAGAFAQGRLGELESQQAQAEFDAKKFGETERHNKATEDIARGVDPVTGKPLSKPRTRAEQGQVRKDTAAATADIKRARVWIRQLSSKGGDPKTIKSLLVQGGSLPTTIEYTGSNAKGEKVKKVRTKDIPVPSFDPDLVRAAFELEGSGYLSDTSVHNLRSTHNVHIPKEWLPTGAKRKLAGSRKQALGTLVQGSKQVVGALGGLR